MMFPKLALALYKGPYRWLGFGQTQVILILCHARSGSTLLNHILLSNQQILSNGERMFNYQSENDLDLFVMTARIRHRMFVKKFIYAVDQLTATGRLANLKLLNSPRVRVIFLIREPVAAISSMLKLAKAQNLKWDVDDASRYYMGRLNMLVHYGNVLKNSSHGLLITYNDIIENTSATLSRIQQFLLLKQPLSEQYLLQSLTGVHGDAPETIRKGQIVRNKPPSQIDCSPVMLEQLKNSFSECLQKLTVFK